MIALAAPPAFTVRRANAQDEETLFAWRNDPFLVPLGTSRRGVARDEHARWFRAAVIDPDKRLEIIEIDGEPAGMLRFDRVDPERCVISVYLAERFTGRGIGTQAIGLASVAVAKEWRVRVIACVRNDNPPAVKSFLKAGFVETTAEAVSPADHRTFVLTRSRVPHNRLTYGAIEIDAVSATVASGFWASGPRVAELERNLATRAHRKGAIAVGSGLGALRLALLALGAGSGDEVVIPAYSCVALANAVLACGSRPVVADVSPEEWNLDPTAVKKVIGPRTKAIIAVHTLGVPADTAALRAFGIPLIEDCSHGLIHGGMGMKGDVAIMSFHATKLVGAGEGGAVLSDDDRICAFVREWRDYGDREPGGTRLNDKMSDITAALAAAQLQQLGEFVARRAVLAMRYQDALAPIADRGAIGLPRVAQNRVWYRYAMEVMDGRADAVIGELSARHIDSAMPVCDWRRDDQQRCSVADRAYRNLVSLPLYPTLSMDEQDAVITALKEVICR